MAYAIGTGLRPMGKGFRELLEEVGVHLKQGLAFPWAMEKD